MGVDREQFVRLMAKFASGVTIVTTEVDGEPHGLTVSAFSSVSLDPPLVLVCIGNDTRSRAALDQSDAFTVNVLSIEQRQLSDRFARSQLSMERRLEEVDYEQTENGGIAFEDALAWFECEQVDQTVRGDHTVYVGEAVDGRVIDDADPLLYYEGEYGRYVSEEDL